MPKEWQLAKNNIAMAAIGSKAVIRSFLLLPSLCVRGVWSSCYDIGVCVLSSLPIISLSPNIIKKIILNSAEHEIYHAYKC